MHPIDYTIVVVYLVAMVWIGLWLQKKASAGIDSYFLGNRSIPWWALGISGMSSNLDVTGTMINTALLFALGVTGFFVEIRGGVTLVMAFVIIFMGKWNRRANVMTMAEWMKFRFGEGRDGDAARIICAIGSIIMTIAMITYFCIGSGKFISEFLGIPAFLGQSGDFWAALLMIVLAMIYTVASGLYGVVWTDVFQSGLIFITIIAICGICFTSYALPDAFYLSAPVNDNKLELYNRSVPPEQQLKAGSEIRGEVRTYTLKEIPDKTTGKLQKYIVWRTTKEEWTGALPPKKFDFPDISQYSMFNLIGLLIFFYLIKVTMEGYGGISGYMVQRYFAARSDRDAGLLSLFWTFLLSFRWPFIASLAIMGISLGLAGDPEQVLPTVVNKSIPLGLKGLLVAGLMAAAMSTFDSTVNSGAAYWVKDIYQAYLKPKATEKDLIFQSRISSIVIVLLGLGFTLTITNINEIWSWITMGIGAGMFIPQLIRWYWARLNGWGFAIGTVVGMVTAILQKSLMSEDTPEYISFSIAVIASFTATVVGALLTQPTDEKVLKNFYEKTRPFGFWGKIRSGITPEKMAEIKQENRRDIIATFFAVPWQIVLFMMWMMLMMKQWTQMGYMIGLLAILSIVLYFLWYRHLSTEVKITSSES